LVLGAAAATAGLFGGLSNLEGWLVLAGTLALGLIGLTDDLLKVRRPTAAGLRRLPKLVAALIAAGLVSAALAHRTLGIRQTVVPWLQQPIDPGWAWVFLATLVVAGCAHAVNLADGVDGLAAGCLAAAFGVLALGALSELSGPGSVGSARLLQTVAIWGASCAGACVAFLWFNCGPASVFLGDVGALGLGAALGILALLSHQALGLLMIGGIFVAEALSVILQVVSYRLRNQRRIFRVAPLHHHFQLGGVPDHQLVVRFWIAGILLAVLGLAA